MKTNRHDHRPKRITSPDGSRHWELWHGGPGFREIRYFDGSRPHGAQVATMWTTRKYQMVNGWNRPVVTWTVTCREGFASRGHKSPEAAFRAFCDQFNA